MTDELVEKMARGLHAIEGSWNDYEWEYLPQTVQKLFMEQAAAALDALRETHHLIPKNSEPVGWLYSQNHVVAFHQSRKPDYTTPVMGFTETPLFSPEKRHD